MKDRRDDEADRRQGERDDGSARCGPVETLYLYLVPPNRMERPSTSRTLPMIDPVMEAFTTLVRPLESAMPAMISSAAFPKVALSNPPKPSPTRKASASVARPIQPATGMMPRAEETKSAVGLMPPGQKRSRIASGTKIRSQSRDGLNFKSLGISRLASANQPVRLRVARGCADSSVRR